MMNKMIIANLANRPVRSVISIAAIALVLTIVMTAATVWIIIDAVNSFNRMLNAALNGSLD